MNFEETTLFYLVSQKKKLVGTLPRLLNMGFSQQNCWQNQLKDSP